MMFPEIYFENWVLNIIGAVIAFMFLCAAAVCAYGTYRILSGALG